MNQITQNLPWCKTYFDKYVKSIPGLWRRSRNVKWLVWATLASFFVLSFQLAFVAIVIASFITSYTTMTTQVYLAPTTEVVPKRCSVAPSLHRCILIKMVRAILRSSKPSTNSLLVSNLAL